jgi:hypothetical protein
MVLLKQPQLVGGNDKAAHNPVLGEVVLDNDPRIGILGRRKRAQRCSSQPGLAICDGARLHGQRLVPSVALNNSRDRLLDVRNSPDAALTNKANSVAAQADFKALSLVIIRD